MEGFNSELKVGDLAMLVGCRYPENTVNIGAVVTVMAFVQPGERVPDEYCDHIAGVRAEVNAAVVRGITPRHRKTYLIKNHSLCNVKYLMPLPKLKEAEKQKEEELA